jgi:hypothetical protein
MYLGKIIKSNSHTDYVCQIYSPGEVENPPTRDDYAFGTFVRIELGVDSWLIGIIYDTFLFNPEFGRLGPRLSPQQELAIFSPDYLNEKTILVGIAAIGMIQGNSILHGVPRLAANSDARVERLNTNQIQLFHQGNPELHLEYAPLLIAQNSPVALHLVRVVIDQLKTLFPEQQALLSVLQDDLIWKSQITPLGGAR